MQSRRIGDVQVGAIGLGAIPMSIEGRPEQSCAIATILGTIHRAFRHVAQRHGVSAQQVCLAWMLPKRRWSSRSPEPADRKLLATPWPPRSSP
jgi:aryl-alcohol dehydrogenase-like predicted oxidoreductase